MGCTPPKNVQPSAQPSVGVCDLKHVPSDRPDIDTKRYIVFWGCVEPDLAPLTLSISARDLTTGQLVTHDEYAAGPYVVFIVGYDTGHNIRIQVELKPAKTGSLEGVLYVSDGPSNRKIVRANGGWRIQTDFTTSR